MLGLPILMMACNSNQSMEYPKTNKGQQEDVYFDPYDDIFGDE